METTLERLALEDLQRWFTRNQAKRERAARKGR